MPSLPPLSILDLAVISHGQPVAEALAGTVALAQRAEARGYERVWYAEHHNMSSIASSATSVLIAHIGAHTSTIRIGAGGIMLPNHSPLTIAEQFGTLASLHPGRIDLGLGRAPGTDPVTWRALRRDPAAADRFPQDVLELQGYLSEESLVPGVQAIPGRGTQVPLYILGSSLFGAKVAAALGLPYGFASHFAPQTLRPAVATYRHEFQPSDQLAEPWVIAGVNVLAADTEEEALEEQVRVRRARVNAFFGRGGRRFSDEECDEVLASPQGSHLLEMMRHTAVGTPDAVHEQLAAFATHADADELMVLHVPRLLDARLRSVDLLADVAGLQPELASG